MDQDQRIQNQFRFIKEIDKEKMIARQNYITDGVNRENDAEHAWHMAIMTILLSEYANEPIDVLKTVTMLLIHDLVEIEAGDTFAYDEIGQMNQSERERLAADHIFSMLPADQAQKFRDLWDEFEEKDTPEARFARTMDRIRPLMLNAATDGKMWLEHGVKLSQIMKRNARTAQGSEILWQYALENFVQPNVENGKIEKE